MKPGFALSLSDDRIDLLQRTAEGWEHVGSADPDGTDFDGALAEMRRRAQVAAPEGWQTKLILPADLILYADIPAPGPDRASRRAQIARALEGRTPYRVEDLVFDWSGTGPEVQVAVVARLTLDEAETFAEAHGFAPVCFVAVPGPGRFAGEPYFGSTRRQAAHLPPGTRLDRDQDPVRFAVPPAKAVPPADGVQQDAIQPAPDSRADADGWVSQPPADEADFIEIIDDDPAEGAAWHAAPEEEGAQPMGKDSPADDRGDESAVDDAGQSDSDAQVPADEGEEPLDLPDDEASADGAPVAGFVSHRPVRHAAEGHSRLEAIAARIRVGRSPETPQAESLPALPTEDAALDESDTAARPAKSLDSRPSTEHQPGDSLLRALDRARNPALAPRPASARDALSQRRLRLALAAAAAVFVALVAVWWMLLEGADTAPLPEATTALESAPTGTSESGAQETPAQAGATEPGAAEPGPATTALAPQPAGPDDIAPAPPAILALAAPKPQPDADLGMPPLAPEPQVSADMPRALPGDGAADAALPAPSLPIPFESLVRFDPAGAVVPTAEGVRTPEGIWLFSGLPPDAPGPRPAAIAEAAAALSAAPATSETGAEAAPLPPPDPATAARQPLPRPAAIAVPQAPAETLPVEPAPGTVPDAVPGAEPGTEPASAPDDAAALPPPSPDPATARLPKPRPAAIAAATAAAPAETQATAVATASRYAIVTSRRPTARPDGMNAAVEAALAAALAEPEAAPAAEQATAESDPAPAEASAEIDEPEPESAAPDIPTQANVAREATVANAIDLGEMSLIGITGAPASRLALVRTSKGRILRVKVGDKLDGGKVAAIGDGELAYVKKGKTYVLKMTKKG